MRKGVLRIAAFLVLHRSHASPFSKTHKKECLLQWAKNSDGEEDKNLSCPYGTLLYGDITWPNLERDMHHDPPRLLPGNEALNPFFVFICIFLSYVPFVLAGGVMIECLVQRGTRELNFFGFVCFIVALNELVWKKLFSKVRPQFSCNFTCGMPSSHAAISVGFLTLMCLDLLFRVSPLSARVLLSQQGAAARNSMCGSWLPLVPPSNSSSITNGQFLSVFLFWFFTLAFVPYSRVYLDDHSWDQVSAGSLVGFIEALIWFFPTRSLAWQFREQVGGRICGIFVHNYTVPRHEELIAMMGGDFDRARDIIVEEFKTTRPNSNSKRNSSERDVESTTELAYR